MSTALTLRQTQLMAGPIGNLDAYIHAVQSVPVLEADEERALAVRFREEDDVEAARALVIHHLRFVVHVARGYLGYGLPLGDLIQEGNVGLMKAVKRFDPEVGVRLVSFAVHWIRAEIHEYVLRNWRVVKVATTKAQRKLFFNLRKAKQHLGWLSHEETKAVAEDLGVSPEEVTEMERRLSARDQSFDPLPDAGDDDDGGYSPQTWLPAEDGDDPAVAFEDEDWEDATHASLHEGLAALDPRSRDIVQSRWLAEEKETLHQLADRYGVSAERIRQIEAAAMKKLGKLVSVEA